MRGVRRAALLLAAVAASGCRSHDPAAELRVSDLQAYWIVDSPQRGQNFVAPVVRFRLRNVSSEPLVAVQA
ncbi:MAG: hypothetical protein ACHP85_22550, partial [Burkholderiales bacterium]